MVVLEASEGDWPTPSAEFGCGLGRGKTPPEHTGQENRWVGELRTIALGILGEGLPSRQSALT